MESIFLEGQWSLLLLFAHVTTAEDIPQSFGKLVTVPLDRGSASLVAKLETMVCFELVLNISVWDYRDMFFLPIIETKTTP